MKRLLEGEGNEQEMVKHQIGKKWLPIPMAEQNHLGEHCMGAVDHKFHFWDSGSILLLQLWGSSTDGCFVTKALMHTFLL